MIKTTREIGLRPFSSEEEKETAEWLESLEAAHADYVEEIRFARGDYCPEREGRG